MIKCAGISVALNLRGWFIKSFKTNFFKDIFRVE